MAFRRRADRRWRGALSVLLAYAFFLQLVFAGIVAERMAFAAGPLDEICATDGHAQGDASGSGAHLRTCAVCALASLTPPIPERIPHGQPAIWVVERPAPVLSLSRLTARLKHDPRQSRGPPANA